MHYADDPTVHKNMRPFILTKRVYCHIKEYFLYLMFVKLLCLVALEFSLVEDVCVLKCYLCATPTLLWVVSRAHMSGTHLLCEHLDCCLCHSHLESNQTSQLVHTGQPSVLSYKRFCLSFLWCTSWVLLLFCILLYCRLLSRSCTSVAASFYDLMVSCPPVL